MKTLRFLSLWLSLTVALATGLQNCKKAEPDPVKPGTTNPGSATTTPGTSTTATVSTVPTFGAAALTTSGITATSATVSATLGGNGGAPISQHGFVYSKTVQLPVLTDSKTERGATSGPFPLTISSNLTGLDANTTYYVRVFATNDKGTGYGAVGQVKTLDSAIPIVNTQVAEEVSPYGFRMYGTITALGADPTVIGEYGFIWSSTNATPQLTDTGIQSFRETARFLAAQRPPIDFRHTLKELTPSQNYYVRSFATHKQNGDDKVVYSDVQTVKTLNPVAQTGIWKEVGPFGNASYSQFVSGTNSPNHYWISSTNTNEVNPLTAAITRRANFPGATSGFSVVAGGPYVYTVGGRRDAASPGETWQFDIANNVWKRLPDFPGLTRSGAFARMIGNNVYYGLGVNPTKPNDDYYKDWWEYNPATNQWTKKADYLFESSRNSGGSVGTKLYLFVGIEKGPAGYSQKVAEYDATTNTWKQLRDAPRPAGQAVYDVKWASRQPLNNKLYVVQTNATYTHLWEHDGATDSWTARRDLSPRLSSIGNGIFLYVNAGKLYAISTQETSPNHTNKLIEFTP